MVFTYKNQKPALLLHKLCIPYEAQKGYEILPKLRRNDGFGCMKMGKHAIGGMRSMMFANRNADMRFRKKSHLRNKERVEVCKYCRYKKGKVKVL